MSCFMFDSGMQCVVHFSGGYVTWRELCDFWPSCLHVSHESIQAEVTASNSRTFCTETDTGRGTQGQKDVFCLNRLEKSWRWQLGAGSARAHWKIGWWCFKTACWSRKIHVQTSVGGVLARGAPRMVREGGGGAGVCKGVCTGDGGVSDGDFVEPLGAGAPFAWIHAAAVGDKTWYGFSTLWHDSWNKTTSRRWSRHSF